ncbi:MAG: dihydroorotase [Candidatus Heimdallarchaeota archaeon]|nr:dihydroorotase [Candidatus Heimdallarchaeota archaeon]MCK4769492.1 dihydroorotase [Candidatus Heimdallarchaeota archaeon]
MVDLNIINGKVFVENELIETGLSIDKGKIIAIGQTNTLPTADKTINAENRLILPGGIDVHTHILDLEFSYREDFYSGTQAASSGGITTILEMPMGIKGKSVIESFDMQLKAMKERSLVDFGLIGSAGYNNIDSIDELISRGAIAFKTFMLDAPEEMYELKDLSAKDDFFLLKIFSKIAEVGSVSCIHAENNAIIKDEINRLTSIGKIDFQAHTDSRPEIAEDEACTRAMILANRAKAKLNLVHMSSKNAFDFIKIAKQKGWDITCEVTPHHLFLTSDDAEKIGVWAKSDPPIRSKEHVEAAWKALNDGTIDIIASDHSPYSYEEKDISNKKNGIFGVGSGTPGLETMIPLLLDAVNKKKFSLQRYVEVTSSNPAKRFGIFPKKGTISLNSDADFIIIDMKKEHTLKNENMFTKQKITIFDGWKLHGKIEKTIIRGEIVYEEGQFFTERGNGVFISPNYNNSFEPTL